MLSSCAQQGALVQRYKGQEIWLFYRLNFASLFLQTVIRRLRSLLGTLKNWKWRQQRLGKIKFLFNCGRIKSVVVWMSMCVDSNLPSSHFQALSMCSSHIWNYSKATCTVGMDATPHFCLQNQQISAKYLETRLNLKTIDVIKTCSAVKKNNPLRNSSVKVE